MVFVFICKHPFLLLLYVGFLFPLAIVVTDRETGRSRGFGFVTYVDAKDAKAATDEKEIVSL